MAITNSILLENETVSVTAKDLESALEFYKATVFGFFQHTKASEKYAIISFEGRNGKQWFIPFYYRRSELFIDNLETLAAYIGHILPELSDDNIEHFKSATREELNNLFGKNSTVTLPIFKILLNECGEWVCNKQFKSPNPQRRIQDIKEQGFTIATKFEDKKTFHMLMPLAQAKPSGYETFSPQVRKQIFAMHHGIDAFTGERAKLSCLPDHKFPEIRWNHSTPASNENLSSKEMLEKFQILPENINQMKREICRKCFQTGIRGKLNGINFYYYGCEKWDKSIPIMGKSSEIGCVGCFWYDMIAWRQSLNKLINSRNIDENR